MSQLCSTLSATDRDRNQLLAEAHDNHLVTGFFGDQELLLAPKRRAPRHAIAQEAFRDLLQQGFVHECARDGFDDGARCRSIYAPTNSGMGRLRDIALELEGEVRLTEARWHSSACSLAWEDGHGVWEVYQGSVLGEVISEFGATTATDVTVAEVGIYRLNVAIAEAAGIDLAQAIHSLPELQNYDKLPIDAHQRSVDFDELPGVLGLDGASTANLVILDRIKVKAAFLGLGIGAQLIRRLLLHFGPGGGIGVLSPFPLQFGGRTDVASDENAYKAAIESLRRYYRGLGFFTHPSASDLMVCNLENRLLSRVSTRAR